MGRIGRVTLAAALAGAVLVGGGELTVVSTARVVEPSVTCTPGYRPCIPLRRSDVDCRGGSGNGPRYTRRGVVYRVRRGYDRYRLDADHDGWGCER
jgi:hypothetical protein